MRNKKGDLSFSLETLISIVVGVSIILLLFFFVIPGIYNLVYGTSKCENEAEWKVIQSAVDSADAGKQHQEIFFYNGPDDACKLASFSPGQPPFNVFPKQITIDKPQLCLCKIDGSSCNPVACQKLNNIDRIEDQDQHQFSTVGFEPHMFLTFSVQNKVLQIAPLGKQSKTQTWQYSGKDTTEVTDPNGMINKLQVEYTERTGITGIKVEQQVLGSIVPEEYARFTSINQFPIAFTATLTKPKPYSNEQEPFQTSAITKVTGELILLKENIQPLSQELQQSLKLFYKKGDAWRSTELTCNLKPTQDQILIPQAILEKQKRVIQTIALCSFTAYGWGEKLAIYPEIQSQDEQEVYDATPLQATNLKDIPESKQMQCDQKLKTEGRCKVDASIADHISTIQSFLQPTEQLSIISATRPVALQIHLFNDYFAGKRSTPVCGPQDAVILMQQRPGKQATETDAAYTQRISAWVDTNLPKVQASINDPTKYQQCPHIAGKAIDIYLTSNGILQTDQVNQQHLREIMCKAGWINYAKEYWHYEYGTNQWEEKQPFLLDPETISTANYPANCYYGGTVQNVA